MMRPVIVAALVAALTGCAVPVPRFETAVGLVQWHKVKDLQDMRVICDDVRFKMPGITYGCYKMDSENKVCHIYAMDNERYFGTLGHELKHCFDGRFHDQFGNSAYPIDK
jgi:hypothetical protein